MSDLLSHTSLLKERATKLLLGEYVGEELLDEFEQYLNDLEKLLRRLQDEELSHSAATELEELLDAHGRLLDLAQEESKALSAGLGIHKQRGRALMRYVDHLPKRLGSMKTKKG